MTVITCKDVRKTYRYYKVLENLNFTIQENTLTGIIGRNGVGKTTLMKMIAGFTDVTTGELDVFSEKPFNNLFTSSNTIMIDDELTFPEGMTLESIFQECERFYPRWDDAFARRLLQYFNLQLKSKLYILSKGKKSTFHAIIGLAARSPLTIFDEPTNGMDAAVRKDFYRALLKDYIAHPRTILLSSHHLEEIEDLLEDVLLIHKRSILFHGSVTELQEKFMTLMGNEDKLKDYIHSEDVISLQRTAPYITMTVNNRLSEQELEALRENGVRTSTVSANDAYVALTQQTKGGIDDVFNEANKNRNDQ